MNTRTIDQLLLGKDMSATESKRMCSALFEPSEDGQFAMLLLVLLRKKGEDSNEVAGFVRSIRNLEKPVFRVHDPHLVDGCGTGGDGSHTFNISTIASLVAAGAGAHVAKHGNRSVTSQCGSSDLMEALGVKIDASPALMLKALRKAQMAYLHAPSYHPQFQKLQSLRSTLAKKYRLRTIFNLIGPLLNPMHPRRQAIGVFQKQLVHVIAEAARALNFKHVLIFWSPKGLDELSVSGASHAIELKDGLLRKTVIDPRRLGLRSGNRSHLKGGDPQLNRNIALKILKNQCTSKTMQTKQDTVILNAAAILYVSGVSSNLKQGIQMARKSIKSGSALNVLKRLISISHGTG